MLLSHRADMITPVHAAPRPQAGTHSPARARKSSQFKDTLILFLGGWEGWGGGWPRVKRRGPRRTMGAALAGIRYLLALLAAPESWRHMKGSGNTVRFARGHGNGWGGGCQVSASVKCTDTRENKEQLHEYMDKYASLFLPEQVNSCFCTSATLSPRSSAGEAHCVNKPTVGLCRSHWANQAR